MVKISLYLAKQQIEQLRELAERTGISMSEHIRRAVSEYLEKLGLKNSDG
jgi:hypothetical protein